MQKPETYDGTRKRSPNFTRRENKVLAELVQVYEDQIERKKTDYASNAVKHRAWQELAKDFNAKLGGDPYRSATVLKHRYENIKKDVRRMMRKRQHCTGSSERRNEPNPLEHIQNYVNSSNSEEADAENDVDIKEVIRLNLFTEETVIDQDDFNDRASVTSLEPKMERIQTETVWVDDTNSLKELQKKYLLEEHRLRLQQMKERHELELENVRLEHKERMRILRQENEAKMEMLELEKTVGIINKI